MDQSVASARMVFSKVPNPSICIVTLSLGCSHCGWCCGLFSFAVPFNSRKQPESLFQVEKPNTQLGIGFDQLPTFIRNHPSFSGNEKAQLANVSKLPDGISSATLVSLSETGISSVKEALQRNDVATAWAAIQTEVLHQ